MRDRQFGNEAHDRDREAAHEEWRALLDPIGPEGDDHSGQQRGNVDGDGHQLRIGRGIAEILDHGRHRRSKSVRSDAAAPERDDGQPYTPVLEPGLDVRQADLVGVRDAARPGTGVQCDAVDNELALALGQELGGLGLVGKQEVKGERDGDRSQTFENEDPFPASQAGYAVHFLDGVGQEAREGARERGRSVEDGHAALDFVALIPDGEKLVVLLVCRFRSARCRVRGGSTAPWEVAGAQ